MCIYCLRYVAQWRALLHQHRRTHSIMMMGACITLCVTTSSACCAHTSTQTLGHDTKMCLACVRNHIDYRFLHVYTRAQQKMHSQIVHMPCDALYTERFTREPHRSLQTLRARRHAVLLGTPKRRVKVLNVTHCARAPARTHAYVSPCLRARLGTRVHAEVFHWRASPRVVFGTKIRNQFSFKLLLLLLPLSIVVYDNIRFQ